MVTGRERRSNKSDNLNLMSTNQSKQQKIKSTDHASLMPDLTDFIPPITLFFFFFQILKIFLYVLNFQAWNSSNV